MKILQKNAQSTLEYAIIVAVVVGALLAMQIYIKRGVEGRMRSSTDNIGDQFSGSHTKYKYTTSETDNTSRETVGYDADSAGNPVGRGKTRSSVVTAAQTTREALSADKEIVAGASSEGLIDESDKTRALFD